MGYSDCPSLRFYRNPRSALPRKHRTDVPTEPDSLLRKTHDRLTGKDGKTPAERLGLAKAPLDYEDIM